MSRIETREHAVIFIYQATFKENAGTDEHYSNYVALNDSIEEDIAYFDTLTHGVLNSKKELDETVSKFLKKWTVNRLPKIDLAILEVAVYEILNCSDIPTSVSINEAVKLAKKFGTDDSSTYINGVLSSFEKSL